MYIFLYSFVVNETMLTQSNVITEYHCFKPSVMEVVISVLNSTL